jgi:hypothetical protein
LSGLCQRQNRPFQHGWHVSCSKWPVSAWLECVLVKMISFSMAGMCNGKTRQFQHDWYSLDQVPTTLHLITSRCPYRAFGRHLELIYF